METFNTDRIVRKLISPAMVWVIVLLLALSCGGGGGGSLLSGGGISGTGRFSGTISGFGSVFVNGVEIETTGALISIDDINSVEGDLKIGMKVQIETTDNVASSIIYQSEIKGPISSITIPANSFTVLGQTVIVDSTTVYEGVSGFAELMEGDIVEVSGFADADSNILATFVELEDPDLDQYSVVGPVSELDEFNEKFKINQLIVNYSAIESPPISNGTKVEVEGTVEQENIMTASEIEIEDFSYDSGDEVEFEGVITFLFSQSDFVVNNQRVQTTSRTEYEHGTASDIDENVRVEIKGTVNSDNIVIAEKVEFRFVESTGIKIKGEADSVDTDNSTVTVFGITIHVDANTALKDESDQELRPFTLGDIQDGDFLEIGGFVDSEGKAIATKVERKNSQEQNEHEIKGPVESETSNSFDILGVTVSVLNAEFEDSNDEPIDAEDFFDAIEAGDIVEAEGIFTGSIFVADEVEIELLIN